MAFIRANPYSRRMCDLARRDGVNPNNGEAMRRWMDEKGRALLGIKGRG